MKKVTTIKSNQNDFSHELISYFTFSYLLNFFVDLVRYPQP